jgi:DNA-binding CsgD family transcriptional regulator/PAS domain-containing protein
MVQKHHVSRGLAWLSVVQMNQNHDSLLRRIAEIGPSLLTDYAAMDDIARAITDTIDGLRLTIAVSPQSDAPPQYVSLTNYDQPFIDSYLTYFTNVNPWVPYYAGMKVGAATRAEDLVKHESLLRTEFYNDWLKPLREADGGFGVGLSCNETASSVLLVNFDHGRSDADKAEIARVLASVSSTVSRFLDFRQITKVQDAARSGIVRSAAGPTWLLNRNGQIIDCNPAAEAIVRRLNPAIRLRTGRLEPTDLRSQAELSETFARLRRGAKASDQPVIRIAAQDASGGGLLVLADAPSNFDLGPLSPMVPGRILATLIHPHEKSAPSPDMLAAIFSLTPAEAQVVAAIASGETIASYSERKSASRLTVRNQLRNAMDKIGVARQTELIGAIQRVASVSSRHTTR